MDGSDLQRLTLGSPCVDVYLEFARARARSNTWLATAYDLLVFFSVVPKEPAHVTTADVFAFLQKQRTARVDPKLVRLEDGEAGLAVRTIKRRLAQRFRLVCLPRRTRGRRHDGQSRSPRPGNAAFRRTARRPWVASAAHASHAAAYRAA
jgi:integrase/recombinase XerD